MKLYIFYTPQNIYITTARGLNNARQIIVQTYDGVTAEMLKAADVRKRDTLQPIVIERDELVTAE